MGIFAGQGISSGLIGGVGGSTDSKTGGIRNQTAVIYDCLSEGPIEGFAKPIDSNRVSPSVLLILGTFGITWGSAKLNLTSIAVSPMLNLAGVPPSVWISNITSFSRIPNILLKVDVL